MWRIISWVWEKISGDVLFQAAIEVGLWTWVTGVVSSTVAFALAWAGDLPAVIVYLAALDAFAITVLAINGMQEIRERKQNRFVGEQSILIPQVSSRDAVDIRQIAFFFEDYLKPTNDVAQRVTNRLWDRIRNSEEEKDWALARFSMAYGFKPCALAFAALNFELDGPDKENIWP